MLMHDLSPEDYDTINPNYHNGWQTPVRMAVAMGPLVQQTTVTASYQSNLVLRRIVR